MNDINAIEEQQSKVEKTNLWHCLNCEAEWTNDVSFCGRCGTSKDGITQNQKGIGGWLEFFIVNHLYVIPLFMALSAISAFIGVVFKPNDENIFTLLISLMLGMLSYNIGKGLKELKPQAVRNVKNYLVGVAIVQTLFLLWVLMFSGEVTSTDDRMLAGLYLIIGLIPPLIWHQYFTVSKRVKVTYQFSEERDDGVYQWESYCPNCTYFDKATGDCSNIHENVKLYPLRSHRKCNGNIFSAKRL